VPANNAIPTTLYVIDRFSSQLGLQGGINGAPSPNLGGVSPLGPLGFTLHATNDGGFDIVPGPGPQRAFAALTDVADNLTRLYTITLPTGAVATPVATPVGPIGNGLTEVLSLAIVPRGIQVVGADAGGGPHVRVFDAATGVEKFSFFAYPASFLGGVRVAAGDVTGDGVADIITAPGPGAIALIRVFDGVTGAEVRSVLAFDFTFTGQVFVGGTYVAAGDVNGDGYPDIVTGAGIGGGPHVRAFSGASGAAIASFFAYAPGFLGSVRVATADANGDGRVDIVTGAGPSGGPHVRALDATTLSSLEEFFAFNPAFGGGVHVGGYRQ
jgi:hypothetical protein